MSDFTRVIEGLPGAPVDEVTMAFVGRGWTMYKNGLGNAEAFLADTLKAHALNPKTGNARLNLGLAYLFAGRDAEALVAYQSVCSENPTQAELAEMRSDLDSALKIWLTPDRVRPIQEVLAVAQPSS